MAKFTLAGLELIQEIMLGVQVGVLLKIKLFTNQVCITSSSVYTDFEICDCPGYADVTLVPANWTIDNFDSGTGQATYPEIDFIFLDNPENEVIYGYICFEQTSSTVIWAESLVGSPFTPIVDGEILPVTITMFNSNVPEERE